MKRALTLLLAALMLVLAIPVPMATVAAEAKVYLNEASGSDENAGTSPEAPFKTLKAALTAIAEAGGRIILTGDVSLTGSVSSQYVEPEHKGNVIITAKDGDTTYDATLKLQGAMVYALNGPTEFENLNINTGSGNTIIAARFNPLVMGEGLAMSSANLWLVGGYESPAKSTNVKLDSYVTVKSGTYSTIVGFSRTKGEATLTYTGTSHIYLYNGTVTTIYGASLYNHYSGSSEIRIYDGKATNLFTAGDVTRRLNGTSLVEIYGGTVNKLSINNTVGDSTLRLDGGTVLMVEEKYASDEIQKQASAATRTVYYNTAAFTTDKIEKLVGKFADKIIGHGTVYVKDGATGNGLSEAEPTGSLAQAIEKIASGGTVVVIGDYKLTEFTEPAHTGTITYTSHENGGAFAFDGNGTFTLGGASAFEIATKGNYTIDANGNGLHLSDGYTASGKVTVYGTTDTAKSVALYLSAGKLDSVYVSKNGQADGTSAQIEASGAEISSIKLTESGETSAAVAFTLSAGKIGTADFTGAKKSLTLNFSAGTVGSVAAGINGTRPEGSTYNLSYVPGAFDDKIFASILPLFGEVSNTKVVFASDDGTGNGLSSGTPTTLTNAFNLVKDGGVIVVCGQATISSSLNSAANSKPITITSVWDGKDYRESGAQIVLGNTWAFNGDVTLENLNVLTDKSAPLIRFNAYNAHIGQGFNVTKPEKYEKYPELMAGKSSEFSKAEYTLTVDSGTFHRVFAVNNKEGANNSEINANLVINGGEFYGSVYGSNTTGFTGSITVTVNGGTIRSGIYGVGKAKSASFSGNLTFNLNGGTYIGKLSAAYYSDAMLNGDMYLNLNGGVFNGVTDILGPDEFSGRMTPHVTIGAGVDLFAKESGTHSFQNPIISAADPWVIYKDGYYYFTKTAGSSIGVAKATNLGDLATADMVTVFDPPDGREYSKNLWSPELHYYYQEDFPDDPDFTEGWYILLACDDGNGGIHIMYCIKALTDDPQGPYGHPLTGEVNIPIKTTSDTDPTVGVRWAAGQTDARINGNLYCLWVSEHTYPNHRYQTLNISKMKNPWTLTGNTAEICIPTESWEKGGATYEIGADGKIYPEVVEGIAVTTDPEGNTYLLYAGSGYWTPYYCIAQLKLIGDDPTVYENWYKYPQPLVTKSNELCGTGHNCYTVSPDGQTNYIVYHAYVGTTTSGGRYMIAEEYTYTENGVKIGMGNGNPTSLSTVYTTAANTMPLIKKLSGWKNEIASFLSIAETSVGIGGTVNVTPTLSNGAAYSADEYGTLEFKYKAKGDLKYTNGLPSTDAEGEYTVIATLDGKDDYSGLSCSFVLKVDASIVVETDSVTTDAPGTEPVAPADSDTVIIIIGAAVILVCAVVLIFTLKKKK
ncbi:MAG: hypothetical protein IIX09_04170 [Clostridia bacterium]|nr:hypothetical protein [Clostridia bacterium]